MQLYAIETNTLPDPMLTYHQKDLKEHHFIFSSAKYQLLYPLAQVIYPSMKSHMAKA